LVERLVWDQEVAGSNPVTPTTEMNLRPILILQIFCGALCFASLRAQDAALPSMDEGLPAQTPTPSPTAIASPSPSLPSAPSPSASITIPQLIPRSSPNQSSAAAVQAAIAAVPALSQLDETFKQTSLGKDAEEFRLHARTRDLQNQIANEPEILEAQAAVKSASTDLEKRKRLQRYYEIYYGRMHALASSADLKKYVDGLKETHVKTLAQPRVRPAPSPGPSATAGGEN
jgi:hypothetical protein